MSAVTESRQLRWRKAVCSSDLDPTARLVALVLDTFMDKRGLAWPSRKAVAMRSGLGVKAVDRALVRIEQSGLLVVQRSRGRHASRYQATLRNNVAGNAVEQGSQTTLLEEPQQGRLATTNRVVKRPPKPPKKPLVLPTPSVSGAAKSQPTLDEERSLERRANPQALVAFFVDQSREIGVKQPREVIGQVARQMGSLADQGYDAQTLETLLLLMLERRLHPSTLPSLIAEAQAGPPKPRPSTRPEHPADAALRRAGVSPLRILEGGGE